MTKSATDYIMLTGKRKLRSVMVKGVYFFIELPSFCAMTGDAADVKTGTVWMSGPPAKE